MINICCEVKEREDKEVASGFSNRKVITDFDSSALCRVEGWKPR